MSFPSPSRFMLGLNFLLVYVFWGSTYLAIDIAVQHIPPALMCAIRFTIAGLLMLGYCLVRGKNIGASAVELVRAAIIGNLLLMGGNLTLSYAELYLPTGLAALLIAITPLWLFVLDTLLLNHHRMSMRGLVGLGLGFSGTLVLVWPKLMATGELGRKEFAYSLALIGASLSWALGSVLAKRWQTGPPTFATTGWQVLFAGLGNLAFALLHADLARTTWTTRGVGAIAYLIIGGSLIGYSAYIYILGHAPTAKVSTYAYVNPVVAVFLGWLVLGERVDAYILAGSTIVVGSVILVTVATVTSTPKPLAAAQSASD